MIAAERQAGSVYVADVVALALQADLVEVGPRCTLHGARCMVYVAWCTLHGAC